jgi:hypothetical protein
MKSQANSPLNGHIAVEVNASLRKGHVLELSYEAEVFSFCVHLEVVD